MQTQLNPSPLKIVAHEFREILFKANESDDPKGSLGLKFNRKWGPSEQDPLQWILLLTVDFSDEKTIAEAPYHGLIRIEGIFEIHKDYPEEKRDSLIKITGASILYGACREMLANLTARSSYGMISLPSISFLEAKKEDPKPVKKKSVKKAKRAKKASPKK